jgi:UDP-2,3-diacylglucosamine hydrolase
MVETMSFAKLQMSVQQETSIHSAPLATTDRLVLLAGEGELPVKVAKNAVEKGFDLFVYALDTKNIAAFKQWVPSNRIRLIRPGLLNRNFEFARQDEIRQAVFAGKVNKWILLRSPIVDKRAMALWQAQKEFNDDAIMHTFIQEFEKEGIIVQRQTDFMEDLLIKPGLYTQRQPTERETQDMELGFSLAKEMGRLDVGQTVIIESGMVLAVETIEGTDQALLRARRWNGKKGGVVVKVEKPNQDLRFDVPTVGPRTLKTMKKAGLKVLAVEAGKTIVLEQETLIRLADKWQMTFIAL